MKGVKKIIILISLVILTMLGVGCQQKRDISNSEKNMKRVRINIEKNYNKLKHVNSMNKKIIKKKKRVIRVFKEVDREIDL